jgi:hypothetical protein
MSLSKPKKLDKSKIKKDLDTIVSLIVRARDNWTCQKCGTKYRIGQRGLTTSHFWNRLKLSVRWNLKNLDALCLGCHTQVEHEKQGWYRTWKIAQLGVEDYNALEEKSKTILHFKAYQMLEMLEAFIKLGERYGISL